MVVENDRLFLFFHCLLGLQIKIVCLLLVDILFRHEFKPNNAQ